MAGERPNVNQTLVQKPSCKQTLFRRALLTEQLTKHGMGPYRDLLSYCHLAYWQGSERDQESCSGKFGLGRGGGSRSVYRVYLARLSFVAGMASVRRHQELTPCQTQLVPAGSRTVLLLPKTALVSDSGGTFAIMNFRKGKKTL